ncbi:MAG: aromatic-ring-hydroxylating dioxygenase subunit beta [Acidimicrobiales bacterium]
MSGSVEELIEHHRIEQFLFLEARLIDERRFGEWVELWTDDGTYWVPANGEHTDPAWQVSLIYDNRARLQTRVERLASGKAYSQQPPPRTAHLVGSVTVNRPAASGPERQWVVQSTVQVAESRARRRVDWCGSVTHHLVERDGQLRIASKKVVLVDNDQELTTIDFIL